MKFQDDLLQRIKDGINIVDIVNSYVPLKKRGGRWWGCCPFHQEKTPSFSVSADKGFYYCFGCHAGGDIFKFLQQIEGISFPEAVERLADMAHVPLPQEEMSPEERARQEFLEKLREATKLADTYFHSCLTKTRMGEAGRAYFEKRHLNEETIEAFHLGFSPDQWDRLCRDFMEKKHISPRILMAAGLGKEQNGKMYDVFRNRCMFPILDLKGRPVAFGGRVMDDSKPKYLNTPETPIFSKGRLLFALYQAIPEIQKKKQVIIVEGYMDAISLHAHGVTNVVASLGTAFTADQARLLKRYADEAVFSYDMDAAGQNADRRALEIAAAAGLKVRVASVGEGKDPDEFVNLHGGEAYLEAVKAARPAMEYLLDSFIRQNDVTSLEGKQKVLQGVLPVLVAKDDPVLIDSYLKKTARLLRLDEGIVRSEAVRYAKEHKKSVYISQNVREGAQKKESEDKEKQRILEEGFLRSCFQYGRFPEGWPFLEHHRFLPPFHEKLFSLLKEQNRKGQPFSQKEVEAALSREETDALAALLMKEYTGGASPLEAYILPLRMADLRDAYRAHTARAEELLRKGTADEESRRLYREEMQACIRLNREIRSLSQKGHA